MKPLTATVTSPSHFQDRKDLDFALEVAGGVDVVALSFVQKAGDVEELKNLVQGRCRVRADQIKDKGGINMKPSTRRRSLRMQPLLISL